MTTEKPASPATAPVDHLRFHRPHAHLNTTFGNDKFALRAEAFARFFGTPTVSRRANRDRRGVDRPQRVGRDTRSTSTRSSCSTSRSACKRRTPHR